MTGRRAHVPGAAGVLTVSARALADRLQASEDPDDVWLELAAADTAADGWLPAGTAMGLAPIYAAPAQSTPAGLSRLLSKAALPGAHLWQSVAVDARRGTAELATVDGPLIFLADLNAKAGLVLPLADVEPQDRGFARALGAAVAADASRAAAPLGGLVLALRWHPGGGTQSAGARISDGRMNGIPAVRVDGDILAALAADGDGLRLALAAAAARAAGLRGGGARRFQDLWLAGRFAISAAAEETAPCLAGYAEPVRGGGPSLIEQRLVAAAARDSGATGRHEDAAARAVLNHHVVPALMRRLDGMLEGLDPGASLVAATARLQAVLATHLSLISENRRALRGPWREDRAASGAVLLGDSLRAARAAEDRPRKRCSAEAARPATRHRTASTCASGRQRPEPRSGSRWRASNRTRG